MDSDCDLLIVLTACLSIELISERQIYLFLGLLKLFCKQPRLYLLGFYSLGYWLPLSSYTLEESVIFRLLVTSNLFIYLLREWGVGSGGQRERKRES